MNIEKDFTQIYYSHAAKVYRLCLGYASGDQELAREWQQEIFIKVWNHRSSFESKSSVGTWIYRIAVNTCLSDLRKAKKVHSLNENMLHTESSLEEVEMRESKIKKMYQCIDQLSAANKSIILLALEEIPQSTIASIQGLAPGALRTRLSRIRNSLLKCMTREK
jgi:RNA polymerase sigma-70 factor (ECF subfamily)